MTDQQSQQGASELALTQLQAGGGAAGAGATGAMLVSPHRRQHNEEWLGWWAFAKPQPEWNASDAHGPGAWGWSGGWQSSCCLTVADAMADVCMW